MSNLNQLHRFRRLGVGDDWPQCVICREDVPAGFTLYDHDNNSLRVSTICDGCIKRARTQQFVYETNVTPYPT